MPAELFVVATQEIAMDLVPDRDITVEQPVQDGIRHLTTPSRT
jgi:hypothetical protein